MKDSWAEDHTEVDGHCDSTISPITLLLWGEGEVNPDTPPSAQDSSHQHRYCCHKNNLNKILITFLSPEGSCS